MGMFDAFLQQKQELSQAHYMKSLETNADLVDDTEEIPGSGGGKGAKDVAKRISESAKMKLKAKLHGERRTRLKDLIDIALDDDAAAAKRSAGYAFLLVPTHTKERTIERSNERTNQRTNEPTNERAHDSQPEFPNRR